MIFRIFHYFGFAIDIRFERTLAKYPFSFSESSFSMAFFILSKDFWNSVIWEISSSLSAIKSSVQSGAFIIAIRVKSSKLPPPKAVTFVSSALEWVNPSRSVPAIGCPGTKTTSLRFQLRDVSACSLYC